MSMAATGILFAVGGTVTRAAVPLLCAELEQRLRDRDGVVVCDVAGVVRPDVVTVEALAGLRMLARRHGRRMVVTGVGPDLLRLVGLLGLSDVLLQAGGQLEEREQAGGVEEVGDGRDPAG